MAEAAKPATEAQAAPAAPPAAPADGAGEKPKGRNDRDRKPRERKPRQGPPADEKLEPVLNEDGSLKNVEKPDNAKKDAKMQEITNEIESLLAERGRVETQQKSSRSGNKPYMDKRRELIAALKEARSARGALLDAASALVKRADGILQREKAAKAKERAAQQALKFRSVEEVDAKVSELERRQMTAQLSRDQEKELMKELSALKQTRRKLEELARQRSAAAAGTVDEENAPLLREQARLKRDEADKLNETLKSKTAELDALTAQNKDVQGKADALQKKRQDIQDKLNKLFAERNEVRAAHDKKWRRYKLYLDEVNKRRDAERKEREEQMRKEREAYEKALEEEEMKKKPWEEEIALCDYLVQHLEALMGSGSKASGYKAGLGEAKKEKDAEAEPQPELRKSADDFGGMQAVGKKTQELDDFLKMGSSSKKSGNKSKKGGNPKAFRLDLDTMNSFASLELKAPTKPEEVPETIKLLKEKRDYFDKLPRAPRKKKGAAAASGNVNESEQPQKKKQQQQQGKSPKVESDELFPSLPGAKEPSNPRPTTPSGQPSARDKVVDGKKEEEEE